MATKQIKLAVIGKSQSARDAQFTEIATAVETNVKENLDEYITGLVGDEEE